MNEQRLIDLEIKVSYQENQIEELLQANQDQYKIIESLEKNLKVIVNKLKMIPEGAASPLHEKPPHY